MDLSGIFLGLKFWIKHKEKISRDSIRNYGCPSCGAKIMSSNVHKKCGRKYKTRKSLTKKIKRNLKKKNMIPNNCSVCNKPMGVSTDYWGFYCSKCGYSYQLKV